MSEQSTNGQQKEMVTLTIDGHEVTVAKGTNIIEAAKTVGTDIPFYCYHPHLSIPGNCRMCQVEVEGAPKLMIGCHTQVQEGMKVKTHLTSKQVEDAQAATLEMLLINHPLDCTVCDQAGHCKLQDYHYEYNARPSRFLENKVKKVKAEPLGPTVMLDGERCIACTRCVRFCDEITGTGEIGLLNRGDRYCIAVNEDRELNNPLSGTVVDLCPVGALTHKKWRFNTRIWYTKATPSICPGCSTGCNVKVHQRDGEIVQVKARLNPLVNKEWLCDEGRYGFARFLPESRVTQTFAKGAPVGLAEGAKLIQRDEKTLILVSPHLLVEDYVVLKQFVQQFLPNAKVAVAYRERTLSDVEKILISPDYAPNYRGAEFAGLVPEVSEQSYEEALRELSNGTYPQVLCLGDTSLDSEERDVATASQLFSKARNVVSFLSDSSSTLAAISHVVFPARSILEKSGLMISRAKRLQYATQSVDAPEGTLPEWLLLNGIAKAFGKALVEVRQDRDLTVSYLGAEPRLKGLTIALIKGEGIDLQAYQPTAGCAAGGASESSHAQP
ncbi:MAG: (2Fe-2S)-binding protein [Bdellovibrionales bacterium]|nr:(2Fe-2S)-binding protein [Bdellovibrionales bacterium]